MFKKKETKVVHEYGTLVKEGDSVHLNDKEDEVAIPKVSFNNLWNFILENKTSDDLEQVMSVHTKKGRQYIKCSRYVGTIQTKDGCTIEILPKILGCSSCSDNDIKQSRKVFLHMLKNFRDSESKSFQNANLSTSENFPILEAYISNYLSETERLLRTGLKKNYTRIQENSCFLKGKLLVKKQISKNLTDKIHFQIEYSKYLENIPQNRLIVSTLNKLIKLTYSNSNKARIYKLLAVFSEIHESENISADLQIGLSANRLFANYENLMHWSSQFLLNRGFTTFSGNHVNQSLLFSAEKLFESYVASMFRKYIRENTAYNIYTQHQKYFLVDKHNATGEFKMKTDIFVESADQTDFASYENIILDTKWKILDKNRPDKHYFIQIADMYQLYAYGQKYALGDGYYFDVHPKLVLIYPATASFKEALPPFFYEEVKKEFGLRLTVCPFDLSIIDWDSMKQQIKTILDIASKNELPDGTDYVKQNWEPTKKESIIVSPESILKKNKEMGNSRYMLVGFVKSEEHWKWINDNKLYNVRIDTRPGALTEAEMQIMPTRIFLYDKEGRSSMCSVNQSEGFYVDKIKMAELNYPNPNGNLYKLYSIAEIKKQKNISVKELNDKYGYFGGAPIFVRY